jgi:hypothetical protein
MPRQDSIRVQNSELKLESLLLFLSITSQKVQMVRSFVSFSLSIFKSRTQLQLEIVYLRKQLEILARTTAKPRLRPSDRLFFSILTDVFISWKETLLIIKPESVVRWHQQGFKVYWRWESRSALGRPRIPQEQIDLNKNRLPMTTLSGELHEFMARY